MRKINRSLISNSGEDSPSSLPVAGRIVRSLSGQSEPVSFPKNAVVEQSRFSILKTKVAMPHDFSLLPPLPKNSAFLSASRLESGELDEKFLNRLIREALYSDGVSLAVDIAAGRKKAATFMPGRLADSTDVYGPASAKLMIIGQSASSLDSSTKHIFSDDLSSWFLTKLEQAGVKNFSQVYLTNLVRFYPPNHSTRLTASWIKDGEHLLAQEIKLVQPTIILALGATVSKALMGKALKITDVEGEILDYFYDLRTDLRVEAPVIGKASLICVTSPRRAYTDLPAERLMFAGLKRVAFLMRHGRPESFNPSHRVISDYSELYTTLKGIDSDPECKGRVLAVDAEWHGDNPVNADAYVRSVQISWKFGHAIAIKFCHAGGVKVEDFHTEDGKVNKLTATLINSFFQGGTFIDPFTGDYYEFSRKRVVGHFFNADIPWLLSLGVDVREVHCCPDTDLSMPESEELFEPIHEFYASVGYLPGQAVTAWERTRHEGGADTGLQAHAIEETGVFKLEVLACQYTSLHRYDRELAAWRESEKLENPNDSLDGYGNCPDDILMPYGQYDADATLRLFWVFQDLLDSDHNGNCCREAFWEAMAASPAALEMQLNGILLDRERTQEMTESFLDGRDRIEAELKSLINWPTFNVRSVQQVRELLYGHHLSGKVDKLTGEPVRCRPEGAICLGLTPLFTSGTPSKPWADVVAKGKQADYGPATSQAILGIYCRELEDPLKLSVVSKIQDYRLLDQALKTVLRPPVWDENSGDFMQDDEGNFVFDRGFSGSCCDDGRIRGSIYQTKETGRWSMARPNLMAVSKKRDREYARILKEDFKYGLRSLFQATPGYVFVAADLTGAELGGMAIMSGDAVMLEHVRRSNLSEDDPEYFDIHCNIARMAFNLNCEPTRTGLKNIGKSYLRDVAKSIIFGLAYGRGAKAIVNQARQEGVILTVLEVEKMIETIFSTYKGLKPFFAECKLRATGEFVENNKLAQSVLVNCFGRHRRFSTVSKDLSSKAEMERQAMNFPIQSLVASLVSRALIALNKVKREALKSKNVELFRFILQVHDEVILEVPYKHVEFVCSKVLPYCMIRAVPVRPRTLSGKPKFKGGEYFLGSTADVSFRWGETPASSQLEEFGLPTGVKMYDNLIVNFGE